MIYRLHNLGLSLDQDEAHLLALAAERLGVEAARIQSVRVVRSSIDARHKPHVQFVYTIDVDAPEVDASRADVSPAPEGQVEDPPLGSEPLPARPVVVGAGPAGLFAALELARFGYQPILIERGKSVQDRVQDVSAFLSTGTLHTESNIVFGSGGAGTFSDGKLTTRRNHPLTQWVLATLVECGAPEAVAYDAKPHVGTDRLRGVCASLQSRIAELGGTLRFEERVDELRVKEGAIAAVRTTEDIVDAALVVVAVGQHCRRTYEMLAAAGVALEAKPFQMGVRIEHRQRLIDGTQYGRSAGHPRLPAADYRLVWKGARGLPSVHSFCMCPGGQVIPAHNEPRSIVTNGWSFSARSSDFANAALVATFAADEYGGGPLAGLDVRQAIEQKAHRSAGPVRCPVQLADDFLLGRTTDEDVISSYPLGTHSCPMDRFMPDRYCAALAQALPRFNAILRGFTSRPALLLGPETRASSPVRIVRDRQTRESPTVRGVYPAGEGAGYAGGIMTSILDGIESARGIMARYAPPK